MESFSSFWIFCLAKQHKQATGLIEQGEEQEGGSEEVEGWSER